LSALLASDADEADVELAVRCRIYRMDMERQNRRRTIGEQDNKIDLMQVRSSAGVQNYPGDRHFKNDRIVTIQIQKLDREPEIAGREIIPNLA
jgi:hypothetical protein